MAGSFHVHNHPGVLECVNMNGNILQIYNWLIIISKGSNNCVQCIFEKSIYFIKIFPPILNSYYPMKG